MQDRRPYVGEGADGCRRSAEIDRSELDTLDPDDPRVPYLRESAAEWDRLAEQFDREADPDAHVTVRPDGTRQWSGRTIPNEAVMVRRDDVRVGDVLCSSHGYTRPVSEVRSRGITTTLTVDLGPDCDPRYRYRNEAYDSASYVPVVRDREPVPTIDQATAGDLRLRQVHRRFMLDRLRTIAHELDRMHGAWLEHDLPSDLLHPQEYPFSRSLDDLTAEVHRAVDALALAMGDDHA
jgi:hypothetical protein